MGVGRGGAEGANTPRRILKISAKKGCILNFKWKKANFTTLAPPGKILEKPPSAPPGKYPSDAHV